ncbi:MAG TPA: glycine zipper 2TM domain-containing protein [Burkholderiales bacterium]|nr:glycine zipper 2TM domain-containing protein [Burkholderiales bacterium]
MKPGKRITFVAAAAALGLAACTTPPYSDGSYPQAQSQYPAGQYPAYPQAQYAQYGYVEAVEVVPVEQRSGPGIGAIGGAIAGGVLGNQIGHGTGRAAATVGGAVAGGVIGHQVEQRVRGNQANSQYRFRVRMDDGSYQTFVQDQHNNIRVGDRVRVENGQVYAG